MDEAAWFSKNIYNAANYLVRQTYILSGQYLNYNAIDKQFKKGHLLPDQQLPMKVVQQVLRQVDHDWQAYFASLAEWEVHPEKFQGKPRLPKYKAKAAGRNLLVYTGTLIIGKNDGWRQAVNLGQRTNQNFVQIPHARFIEMLTYKAQLAGINVITTEESYTSKCSFFDLEPISKHEHYMGRRVKRGLFRTSDGRQINADVNGAYNIVRKVIPDAFGNGIGGAVVHPVRVQPA